MSFKALQDARTKRHAASKQTSVSARPDAPAPALAAPATPPLEEILYAGTSDSSQFSEKDHAANAHHGTLPLGLCIRRVQGRGRGLFVKAGDGGNAIAYRAGTPLLTLTPHTTALSTTALVDHCSRCCASPLDKAEVQLRTCTACKIVRYCGAQCQSLDWRAHKPECASLSAWMNAEPPSQPDDDDEAEPKPETRFEPDFTEGQESSGDESGKVRAPPSDAIRAIARLLWGIKRSGTESLWTAQIFSMQSHRDMLSTPGKEANTQHQEEFARLVYGVTRFMGVTSPDDLHAYGLSGVGGEAGLVGFISKFTTNTFALSSPSLSPLGASVSPLVALANHSCAPNAVVVFPGGLEGEEDAKRYAPVLQVVALRDIAFGEEILTSYIDTTLPTPHRRETLRTGWGFLCSCDLCVGNSNQSDMRTKMYCPRRKSHGCNGICEIPGEEAKASTRCEKCGLVVRGDAAREVADLCRIGEELVRRCETSDKQQPPLQTLSRLIPLLARAGLVEGAHPLLSLRRVYGGVLVEEASAQVIGLPDNTARKREIQELLDETLATLVQTYTGLAQLLIPGHPVRAIAAAEVGRIASVDEPEPPNGTINSSSASSITDATSEDEVQVPHSAQRLTLALKYLKTALEECKIGFGSGIVLRLPSGKVARGESGGATARLVRETVVRLEQETEVWKRGVRDVRMYG